MIAILVVLSAGILLGLLIVKKPKLHLFNNHLLNWAIYLLLFLLGISVGTNREVIQNIGKIGYEAIAIGIFSIAGSVLLSAILFKFLFKQDEK
ncbi:MAG: LysO family transporter [Bacteroidia bacterium]|nr:LysO family transporter [Bacteroidia bacterium]